jgi:hypothetical protein
MHLPSEKNQTLSNELIRYVILAYWSVFWLFNSIDKLIGGSHFLWVGRDRFAQFQKFFASAGMDSPLVANIALVIAAALEVFAFVFFTGALIHFIKKNQETARSWFFVGIILTLITFTVFSIGDHVFGDRFELLEHTLFWFLTLFTWVVFIRIDRVNPLSESIIKKKQLIAATLISVLLVVGSTVSIFNHNTDFFIERSEAVPAKEVGKDLYKFSFPFLGGSTVFENTIEQFQNENPNKRIIQIYTVPNPLRLKKADGLIFYITTENKR